MERIDPAVVSRSRAGSAVRCWCPVVQVAVLGWGSSRAGQRVGAPVPRGLEGNTTVIVLLNHRPFGVGGKNLVRIRRRIVSLK